MIATPLWKRIAFAAAAPVAARLYLTRVLAEVEGDAYFPPLDMREWRLLSGENHPADEKNDYAHCFEVYERVIA